MSAQDLINWGELSRLLSGSRMNIRKNRIPEKYKVEITSLVKHIETWQTEIQTAALADEAIMNALNLTFSKCTDAD